MSEADNLDEARGGPAPFAPSLEPLMRGGRRRDTLDSDAEDFMPESPLRGHRNGRRGPRFRTRRSSIQNEDALTSLEPRLHDEEQLEKVQKLVADISKAIAAALEDFDRNYQALRQNEYTGDDGADQRSVELQVAELRTRSLAFVGALRSRLACALCVQQMVRGRLATAYKSGRRAAHYSDFGSNYEPYVHSD